jgi:transcription elongation factor Elf1
MSSKYSIGGFDEDDESKSPRLKRDKNGVMRQVGLKYEFDCPDCSANNPWDEGFKDGSEVICHYCGQEFRVQAIDEKRFKFRAL